jgi:hypothetical protein
VILVEGNPNPKLEHYGTSIKFRKNKKASNCNPSCLVENYIIWDHMGKREKRES